VVVRAFVFHAERYPSGRDGIADLEGRVRGDHLGHGLGRRTVFLLRLTPERAGQQNAAEQKASEQKERRSLEMCGARGGVGRKHGRIETREKEVEREEEYYR
jgi:hypothetical protein